MKPSVLARGCRAWYQRVAWGEGLGMSWYESIGELSTSSDTAHEHPWRTSHSGPLKTSRLSRLVTLLESDSG